ncbi:MAG: ATP-binding protein [Cellvibrionaceae bacterium]
MGLKPKFFIVILIVNGLLATGLYLFLSWNFERSFSTYLNQRELRVLDSFANQLEDWYGDQGNWDYFKQNPTQWNRFTFQVLAKDVRRRDRRVLRQGDDSNIARNDDKKITDSNRRDMPALRRGNRLSRSLEIPIALLDTDKKLIVGSLGPSNEGEGEGEGEIENIERSLIVDGDIVGFLSIPTRPSVRDYLDNQFIKDQSNNLLFVLICIIIFAILSSALLSLFLIKRINQLVQHVKLLTFGEYKSPVPINGKDELSILSHYLTDLGSTLNESTQQRKQWVADISHELRTPVAILQADLEAIEDGIRALNQTSISRLQRHVIRLKDLISDLYELSLSDIGSLSYNKKSVAINEILEDSIQLMTEKIKHSHLSLEYKKSNIESPITVLGDENRLLQLFLNLLENSIKYTDGTEDTPGVITIDLHVDENQQGKTVVITIQDSAPTVDNSLLHRLTERLYRVDMSRNRETGGSGLGLSICENIILAHKGVLHFSQSELGGLKVIISIPILASPSAP